MAEPPRNDANLAPIAIENTRFLNSDMSSIGSGVLSSHRMNPTRRIRDAEKPASIGAAVQPSFQALVMASRKATSAPDDNAAPAQSNDDPARPALWLAVLPLSTRPAEVIARIDTGIPAKKMDLQPNSETSTPPTIGPMIAPLPMIAMYIPIALPRWLSGKTSVMSAMLLAWTPAEARPWTIFTAISTPSVCDIPPTAASTTKKKKPNRYTRFRPIMSDSRPIGISIALVASV